jgi:hypothetical protein
LRGEGKQTVSQSQTHEPESLAPPHHPTRIRECAIDRSREAPSFSDGPVRQPTEGEGNDFNTKVEELEWAAE